MVVSKISYLLYIYGVMKNGDTHSMLCSVNLKSFVTAFTAITPETLYILAILECHEEW